MNDIYERALCIARIKAKAEGYAVALHGSGIRDLDLIAVPWTEEATEPAKVILSIISGFQFEFGHDDVSVHDGDMAMLQSKADGTVLESSWGSSATKPHGRAAILINIGANLVVDLSIMPRIINT